MTALGEFFPRRTNDYVPNMQYAADVRFGGMGTITIPAPVATDADGILAGHSIAEAGDTREFADTYTHDSMAKFGRNVVIAASGEASSGVTIEGTDYLGQRVVEELALNNGTAVVGNKTFKTIEKISYEATAARTISVGWGNRLGLPYKIVDLYTEQVNGVEASSAGSVVAGSNDDPTATSADPRGTYTPHTSAVPNGEREYKLTALWDTDNLHGVEHFAG